MYVKNFIMTATLSFISISAALCIGEVFLRLKNTNTQNYDIEMWRYAKELKRPSKNPSLGHEHISSSTAVLQSINFQINSDGLRGKDIEPKESGQKRILFLGSSITLGWGVKQEETTTERLNQMFKAKNNNIHVLNAGIGNYNTVRYVELFLSQLTHLAPDTIVVQYFVNDAEVLEFSPGNWFLRNSQLAVTLWIAYNRIFSSSGELGLLDHYKAVYDPNSQGYQDMTSALKKLSIYAKENNIKVLVAMIPDFHNLTNYPFGFIHSAIKKLSKENGFTYADLLPAFEGREAKTLWSMPGDPHPNGLGHELMAKNLYPILNSLTTKSNMQPQ
jgi:lysophospholipase L1-like esterase